ncbi:MAG: site-2 protease family protein [Actinomycetota bacterium]
MSSFYNRVRHEIVSGGDAVDHKNPPAERGRVILGGGIIVALMVYLGIRNIWTLMFVIGLLVSVLLHELGHFVTARRTGMKVTQFYMGFGPRLWSTVHNGVEYGVRVLPLGAYVRIIGMNNLDACDPADEPRSYRSQSYPKRMLVITAGSLMHIAIALVLFFGVYAVAGRYAESGSVKVVGAPISRSPAQIAGIEAGDIVLSFDDAPTHTRAELIQAIVSHQPGDVVEVVVSRDGQHLTRTATLASNPADNSVAFFGISSWSRDYIRLSPLSAARHAIADAASTAVQSVGGVFTVLNPRNIVSSVTSPIADPAIRPSTVVGASQVGGSIGRQEGFKGILMLLAGVNVFIGVFNMFPLLPFDGGHAAIATYERLRSRGARVYRADVGKMVPVATAVVALLVLLMFAGLYLDITQPLG